jgi:carboxyl-terminal processing protease
MPRKKTQLETAEVVAPKLDEPAETLTNSSSKRRLYIGQRVFAVVVVAVLIFGLGVSFGDGRINIMSSNSSNGSLPNELNYSSVNQVYQALKANYDGKLTETELLNGIKHGLASAPNDPYTDYFTPAESKEFNSELNESFSGIGAELSQNSSGDLEIIAPVAGTPAAKAGLMAQDIIAEINGKTTAGMSETRRLMRFEAKPVQK